MKRVSIILFIFVLIMGIVCSSDGWEDISSGDNIIEDSSDEGSGDISEDISNDNDASSDNSTSEEILKKEDSSKEILPFFLNDERYTRDFYIALGIGGLGILIILLFFYLFIRGPKNKWKKKITKKKTVKKKKKKIKLKK